MKTINIIIAVIIVALLTACSGTDRAKVKINIQGAPDSTGVVVSILEVSKTRVLDTVYLKGGKAEYTLTVLPGTADFVYLSCGDRKNISLVLGPGDRVSVDTPWDSDALHISSSPESELMQEVDGGIRRFNAAFDSLSRELVAATDAGRDADVSRLQRELGMLYVKCKHNSIKYILANPRSMTVIPVLYQKTPGGLPVFSQITDAIIMEKVYDTLRTFWPSSPYLMALADEVALRKNALEIQNRMAAAEEVDFPEIVLSDINGNQQSLSSLKGKVIVLIFWDATNVQQRVYNVDLKSIYERYHARGLEVYQVALNSDKTAWAMQVKEQELPWISVCDPAEGASVGSMLYNVTQLPSMYVISREGEITSRDVFDMNKLEIEIRRLL